MNLITIGVIGILVLSIGLGQPLYVLLGGLACFLLLEGTPFYTEFTDLQILIEQTRGLSENEVLLAIPFFVISGALMSEGDISKRLVRFANTAFRGIPGGLAVSAVIGCIFFAAISGSSPVTVIAIGSIVFPAMQKANYPDRFSVGLLSSAGSLGILIPPSIPMIVYAIVDPKGLADPANYQIAPVGESPDLIDLFLAGALPGLIIGMLFVTYSIIEGARKERDDAGNALPLGKVIIIVVRSIARFAWRILILGVLVPTFLWVPILLAIRFLPNPPEFLKEGAFLHDLVESFWDSFWALMLPVIILGGIYSGIFTATEAACVSVVYAAFVELFIYRSLKLGGIPRVFGEATVLIGSLLIIIAVAQGFNRFLVEAEVPQFFVEKIVELQLSTVAFLLLINVLLLVVGFFMDIMSAILILVPLLSPIAFQLGIHPIHLAIIFIVNLEIGYLTPPLGLNLFVASTIFKKPIGETIRSVIPFIGVMLVGLMFITYVPTLSIGPVAAYNGHSLFQPFPERKLPMETIKQDQAFRLLSQINANDQGPADDAPAEQEEDDGKVKSMAEILAQGQEQIQEESVKDAQYEDVDDLIFVFDLLHRNIRDLDQLGELDIDELREDYDAGRDEGTDDEAPSPESEP
jgi:C4-dicarboxylate transporter DctM subunit